MAEDSDQRNFVIVGAKPTMNYVIACITLFNEGAPGVRVRARGRHISKAVDAIELLRRVFIRDARVESIQLGTDTMNRRDGSEANVSMIEIQVSYR